jgi:Ca2+-binding RTX toxin-like protein
MRPSSLVRLFVVLLWVSTVWLVCVPALEAATVSMTAEEYVDVTLTFEAAPGEANEVGVTMTTDLSGFIVSETGSDASGPLTLTAGPGCTSLGTQVASCVHNVEDITETPFHVVLDLGDNHDGAWASDACGALSGSSGLPLGEPLSCEVRISAGEGADSVFMNDGGYDPRRSVVYGGPARDSLHAGEAGSRLLGGRGDDDLTGGPGRDMISGGGGEDTIWGGLRRDELRGRAGADIFYADDGYRDRLFGGTGRDRARVDRGLDRVRSIERFFEGFVF